MLLFFFFASEHVKGMTISPKIKMFTLPMKLNGLQRNPMERITLTSSLRDFLDCEKNSSDLENSKIDCHICIMKIAIFVL